MTKLKFIVVPRFKKVNATSNNIVIFRRDNWNDFGFVTLFDVELRISGKDPIQLGSVKILKAGQESGETELPGSSFSRLDENYCSLGQDLGYYEKLAALDESIRVEYLDSIRDAVHNPQIVHTFSDEQGWKESLIRFGEAEHALRSGAKVLQSDRPWTVGAADFRYDRTGGYDIGIPFKFDDNGDLPGRCSVLIGYNGVGKTRLLADIANVISGVQDRSENKSHTKISGEDSTFAAVIAISYSPFDSFEIPEQVQDDQQADEQKSNSAQTTSFGYTYCGLRRVKNGQNKQHKPASQKGSEAKRKYELKSSEEIDLEFVTALKNACDREDGGDALRDAFQIIEKEPSFGRIGIQPSIWVDETETADSEIANLSTGHKIVANIIVQLAAHLQERSLVLLDEPETHLHPPLLAALLSATQRLLRHYDSFAVVATHSPVVLQEIPSQYVHVLTRVGSRMGLEKSEIETYGANVGEITRDVFSLDSSATDYQGALKKLAAVLSLDEIEDLFPRGLSSQARALVLRASSRRRVDHADDSDSRL